MALIVTTGIAFFVSAMSVKSRVSIEESNFVLEGITPIVKFDNWQQNAQNYLA